MTLSTFKFAEKEVSGGLTVRGLSFSDISLLVKNFGPELADAFGKVEADADIQIMSTIKDLLPSAPGLVATIIACGCGESDKVEIAKQLPFAVQIEALEKIGELTFLTEGGAKKVFQMVMRMMSGASDLMTSQV